MADKEIIEFLGLFEKVSKNGWIKSVSNDWGSCGKTFEHEIGKKPDAKYNPDYKNIEIKCSTRYSRFPLFLFTIKFDGETDNEIERLTNLYGRYDTDFKEKKVLFKNITQGINYKEKYSFNFKIDYINKRIVLIIYDEYGNLIDNKSYINFDSIKEHYYTKLKTLPYIKASYKSIDNEKYYRYYSIFILKIKSFEEFLKLIEKNILKITVISRISKSGNDKGKYMNKNVVFSLPKKNINDLFDCVIKYNNDEYY